MKAYPPGIFWILMAGSFFAVPRAEAAAPAKAFGYISSQYLITAEVGTAHSFVVNFINLSDFVIVVQPSDFIYKSASGRFYIGQVYDQEHKDNRGESYRYIASVLLKGRSFTGLTVIGAFHEQDQIEELSVRIGAKRYYLQPMEQVQFEQLAAKIEDLDLKNPNSRGALQEANIAEAGTVKSTDGTSEWDRDWQGLISLEGVNSPKIIERPEITPTEDARRANSYGKIRLSATITKNGAVLDSKVIKGLGHGLDERALEGVRNSWAFLPATKNGEVVETNIFFEVEFPAPAAKRP